MTLWNWKYKLNSTSLFTMYKAWKWTYNQLKKEVYIYIYIMREFSTNSLAYSSILYIPTVFEILLHLTRVVSYFLGFKRWQKLMCLLTHKAPYSFFFLIFWKMMESSKIWVAFMFKERKRGAIDKISQGAL